MFDGTLSLTTSFKLTVFDGTREYPSNTVSLNFTLNATYTCALTNIVHQNSDYLQFLLHTQSHSAEVNDVIITVNRTSTFIFPNFRELVHQNSDYLQFLLHTQSHSAEVNDVIITVNRTSTFIFPNFREPGPKIPEITLTLKMPSFNVRTRNQIYMQ